MWYAAYLGADAPIGNRDRLKRELDRLAALGINNVRILGIVRILAAQEFRPPDVSRPHQPLTTRRCCAGLDHALAEMGKRGMTAVIYLTNFWEWSGGMMTYLYWTNGGRYINMNDPAHPWPEFADMSSEFYGQRAGGRDVRRLCPRGRRTPQQRHRPALSRRSGDHGVAARQRAAARRKRRSRAPAHDRLSRVDRRDGAADQVARPQPSGLDRKRGDAGLHQRRPVRRRCAHARPRSIT